MSSVCTNGLVLLFREEEEDRVNILRLVAEELQDPLRDYKKFDHGKRAK